MWKHCTGHPLVINDNEMYVRAFAEDSSSPMGTTWPPRSYTCSFCRREFRSAQALGGHMNVHRRDRALLRLSAQVTESSPSITASPHPTIVPSPEFSTTNGFLYPLPNSVGPVFTPSTFDSPYTLLSYHSADYSSPMASPLLGKVGMVRDKYDGSDNSSDSNGNDVIVEELNLELRLGW